MNVASGESSVHELSSVVTVPHTGWYGFCLQVVHLRQRDLPSQDYPVVESPQGGPPPATTTSTRQLEAAPSQSPGNESPGEGELARDASREEEDGTRSVEACASSSLELRVQAPPPPPTTTPCSDDETCRAAAAAAAAAAGAKTYPLPFVHDGIQLNQSLRIGRGVFLERGAAVRVLEVPAEPPGAVEEGPASGSDPSTAEKQHKVGVRWRLVPHHLAKEGHRRVKTSAADGGVDRDDAASPRRSRARLEPPTKRKTLVCAECRKGFASIRDITNHLRSRHRHDDGDVDVAPIETGMVTNAGMPPPGIANDNAMWTVPLVVLHNDDVMSVIVKPQGMPVMGASPSLMRSDLLLPLLRMAPVPAAPAAPAAQTQPMRMSFAPPGPIAPTASSGTGDGDGEGSEGDGGSGPTASGDQRGGLLLRKPRPVHRLDAGTGGLLVVAKTLRAEADLRRSFANGRARKTYVAIVIGKVRSPSPPAAHVEGGMEYGVVDAPVSGKPSRTLFRTLRVVPSATFGFLTEVELLPQTGRRHQLRRHMQHLGHSILGDVRYMTERSVPYRRLPSHLITKERGPYSRLCLWATRIRLPNPSPGRHEQVVDCAMPEPIEWLEFVLKYEHEQLVKTNPTSASQ